MMTIWYLGLGAGVLAGVLTGVLLGVWVVRWVLRDRLRATVQELEKLYGYLGLCNCGGFIRRDEDEPFATCDTCSQPSEWPGEPPLIDSLLTRLHQYQQAFPHCDRHKPDGGARSGCLVCALTKVHDHLSRLDEGMYPEPDPNPAGKGVHATPYTVDCDEKGCVDRVIALLDRLPHYSDTGHRFIPGVDKAFALTCNGRVGPCFRFEYTGGTWRSNVDTGDFYTSGPFYADWERLQRDRDKAKRAQGGSATSS